MQVNDKVKVYLETHGFHYHECDDTWVDGYFDMDSIITQINFYNEYGYKVILNDYGIYDEEDLNLVKEILSKAKQIYSTCCNLMEDVA